MKKNKTNKIYNEKYIYIYICTKYGLNMETGIIFYNNINLR